MHSEQLRVAIYTRVSTEDQARDGFSLDAQEKRLKAYSAVRGWEVVDIYRDEGYSGRTVARPEYQRMFSEMDRWDVVLVLKMDRIHRNSVNFTHMMEVLKDNGKDFNSMMEKFDSTTAMGRFVMDIVERMAQLESEQIGERTYVGMREKAETMRNTPQGSRTLGFNPPYGYLLDGGLMTAVPEELRVVREVFDEYLAGNSLAKIAESLNRSGLRTRRGNRWTVYNLSTILHNPVYAGYLRWEDLTFRHYAETPLDPVTFNRVQTMAAAKERNPSKRSPRLLPEEDFEL